MQSKTPLNICLDLVPVLLVIGLEVAIGVLDPLGLQVSLLGEVDGVLCSQLGILLLLAQPSLAEPGNFVLPPSLLGPGSSLGSWWLRGHCLGNWLESQWQLYLWNWLLPGFCSW